MSQERPAAYLLCTCTCTSPPPSLPNRAGNSAEVFTAPGGILWQHPSLKHCYWNTSVTCSHKKGCSWTEPTKPVYFYKAIFQKVKLNKIKYILKASPSATQTFMTTATPAMPLLHSANETLQEQPGSTTPSRCNVIQEIEIQAKLGGIADLNLVKTITFQHSLKPVERQHL